MVMRTARESRKQFWGCSSFPRCRGTRELESGPAATRTAWIDGTILRPGWLVRYRTVGGSLRSLAEIAGDRARRGSLVWIAQTATTGDAPDEATARVVGVVSKIIERGAIPPLHPSAERLFLDRLGVKYVDSELPGDISVRLPPAGLVLSELEPMDAHVAAALDPLLPYDSDEERAFHQEWVPRVLGQAAARWFVPQASLDALADQPASSGRRVDFLVTAPWLDRPLVVEIDGEQHGSVVQEDKARDQELRANGCDVVRLAASEVRSGAGPGLDDLVARWRDPGAGADDRTRALLLVPSLLHQLLAAVCQAIDAGYLQRGVPLWRIGLDDPTGHLIHLAAPYLDLLASIDDLWAGDVVPDVIDLGAARFQRTDFGFLRVSDADGDILDVRIVLEPDRTGVEALPTADQPTIVVRSARLPLQPVEPELDVTTRVPARGGDGADEFALRTVLQTVFAKADFREGQLAAIRELLAGRDCAVLLPTGAGKSIVYQLAGLCSPGRTIVVDPLVSLIEDQVRGLERNGIDRALAITSWTTAQGGSERLLAQVRDGHALFIIVSPERFQQRSFRESLQTLTRASLVNLAVVDEAHCVSEWGHDFRPSYLNLGRLLRELCADSEGAPPPVAALTGTASRTVLKDVLDQLRIIRRTEHTIVRPMSFDRKELHLRSVRSTPAKVDADLLAVLSRLPSAFRLPTSTFFAPRGEATASGIVFCQHGGGRVGAEDVAGRIMKSLEIPTAAFRGGTDPRMRENARRFRQNEVPLLVSTKAFGMGIDKPNVRYVVHYGISGSIEAYYQEVGRAGRDRKDADCFVLLSEYDEARARHLLDDATPVEELQALRGSHRGEPDDDITRQLYFHAGSFRGAAAERKTFGEVLDDLQVTGDIGRRRVARPEGDDGRHREHALHRAVSLGLVRDYLVNWSAGIMEVELAAVDRDGVIDALAEVVRRSQPARAAAVREEAKANAPADLIGAAVACGSILIDFVYDTIEKSRRRALREMWLAARDPDPDGLRSRVLDYLTQGDVSARLERFLDEDRFQYDQWIEELAGIADAADARELRGNAGRLLAAYPDHPGLLLARGMSEAFDPLGDVTEVHSNVRASLRAARDRYGVSDEDVATAVQSILNLADGFRPEAAAAALCGARDAGVPEAVVREVERTAVRRGGDDAALAVLELANGLTEVLATLPAPSADTWKRPR